MNTYAEKTKKNKSQSMANFAFPKQGSNEATFQLVDNRPEAIAQKKLQSLVDNRPHTNIIQRYTDRKVISPSTLPAARCLSTKMSGFSHAV